jgi:methylglyoxal synthase
MRAQPLLGRRLNGIQGAGTTRVTTTQPTSVNVRRASARPLDENKPSSAIIRNEESTDVGGSRAATPYDRGMNTKVTPMTNRGEVRPRIALIAHDACKDEMAQWATFNKGTLQRCSLFGTATTGKRVADMVGLPVELLLSGPRGGDAQVGAMISENKLDAVVFFWDPLTIQPHDVDIKMLLRLAVLHNVPIACNRSSADFLISSPLFFNAPYFAERMSAV